MEDAVVGLGLNDALVRPGRPDTLRLTCPLNPFAGLTLTVVPAGWPVALRLALCVEPLVTAVLIVELALPPAATPRLLGLALSEKSDGAGVVELTATSSSRK